MPRSLRAAAPRPALPFTTNFGMHRWKVGGCFRDCLVPDEAFGWRIGRGGMVARLPTGRKTAGQVFRGNDGKLDPGSVAVSVNCL